MKQNKNYILCTLIAVCFFLNGCKKFVEVPPPATLVTETFVFTSDATATATVTGLYSQAMSNNRSFLNSALTALPGLSADELVPTSPNADLEQIQNNAIQDNNFTVWGNLWVPAYSYIYHANAALEGLEKSKGLSQATRLQLKGELLFFRALCYHYLVNLFGDVPLVTGTNYSLNATHPRTPVADICQQLVKDLKEARELLVSAYPVSGRIRPNRWAATALLARVYLYLGEWQEAETTAAEVISAPPYSLVVNPANAFLSSSMEAIWQLSPVQAFTNTGEGNWFVPSSAAVKPVFAISASLLDSFEPGDKRKEAWVGSNTIAGTIYYYPHKYKVRSGGTPYSEHNNVLRLAEQILIRAEAHAQLDRLADAKADLDAIRARAGLPPTTATEKEELLAAIEKERRVELAFEWGHRWFDLKRWGKADEVLSPQKNDWKPSAVLYPIPRTEMERNPFLIQNSGY